MVFKTIKKKDIVTLILLVLLVIIIIHYYVDNQARNRLIARFYPIKAQMALQHISCSPDSPTWLRQVLTEKTKNQRALANQIAYIAPDGQQYHCESGYIDTPMMSDPIKVNDRFRYASITKLWTADAILDMVKQGQLSLDTKLVDVLPMVRQPVDAAVNDITIEQLLTHQGGFNRNVVHGYDMFNIGEPICPDHLEKLNDIHLNFVPGSQSSYSNLGYCLLGKVIEQVSGKPFNDYIEQHYGIHKENIRFIGNQALPDEVLYHYAESGLTGVANVYSEFDYTTLNSSAGLSGNAMSLAKQAKQMLDKPSPNIRSENSQHKLCDFMKKEVCYGYAMVNYQPIGSPSSVLYKDGDLLGVTSLLMVGDQGGIVALLSNANNPHGLDDKHKIMDMIIDKI